MDATAFDVGRLSAGLSLILAAVALGAGGSVLIGRAVRMRRELIGSRVARFAPQASNLPASASADAIGPAGLLRNPKETAAGREVARRLGRLGVPAQRANAVFAAVQLTAGVAAAVLAFLGGSSLAPARFTGVMALSVTALIGFLGWYVPVMVMKRLSKARLNEVAIALPEALELLVICAEAGLALGDGIDRIVRELKLSRPALAEELAQTAADLKILPSREQALMNFADRVDVPGVRSLVTTLSQTMRYGTPLAQAMRVVAAEMRNESLIHLEERANRLPALLTVPMMLFIMPTIFLVVGGPAAIKLIDAFAK